MTAALTAVLAGLVVLAGYADDSVLALAVLVVQLVLLAGWFRVADVPGEYGGILVGAAAAVAADFLPVLRDHEPALTPVAPVLGIAFVAALLAQLARTDGRRQLTTSLAATVTGTVVVLAGSMFVAAVESRGGATLVATTAAAVAAGTLATLLPANVGALRVAAGAGLGLLAGIVVGLTDDVVGPVSGAWLGVAAGLVAMLAATLTAYGAGSRPIDRTSLVTVGASLPLLLSGIVAYVFGRILTG